MKYVARRTGLSPHVIRVWERRYGAVQPQRSGTQRRLYSEAEIERLSLLAQLSHAGHTISAVAHLSLEALRDLAAKAGNGPSDGGAPLLSPIDSGAALRADCMRAVRLLDPESLNAAFERALIAFGSQGLLRIVLAPLAEEIGDSWEDGQITAAHEHFFTAAAKVFLGLQTRDFTGGAGTRNLIACTPAGQLHELGALMVAAAATNLGWRVTYLGPSLPAAEIAGAARQKAATVVALSIVYPADDPNLPGELFRLRHYLPPKTHLLVGGRAIQNYAPALAEIGAEVVHSLEEFSATLDKLRTAEV